jgi:C-terminal processing protease CtpA/Prc
MRLLSLTAIAVLSCACGPHRGRGHAAADAPPRWDDTPAAPRPIAPPAATTSAAGPSRAAFFDRLAETARRYHVFSETTQKNLGYRWDAELPALKAAFTDAKSNDELVVALTRFANSLHDVHCQFRPTEKGEKLRLGFDVAFEWKDGRPQLYVDRVSDTALARDVTPGDVVVSIDGVPGEKVLRHHLHDSNMSSTFPLSEDVAGFLTRRRTTRSNVRAGDTSTWVLRGRAGGDPRTVRVHWEAAAPDSGGDFALDFGAKDCANAAPRSYGGYAMVARGYRLCVYASTAPRYKDYPIVRQVSFRYDELPHGALADYELLRAKLGPMAAKGIILDVQDNGGGVNPNLFLDWWGDKPYTDTFTNVVFDDAFKSKEAIQAHGLNMSDAQARTYLDALGRRSPGERFAPPRPFMCKPDTCDWDNRYTPSHRITKLPVALVLGPDCGSSCDAFAWHFDKDDFGPIVGRPSMGGFTTHRARFPVALRAGEKPLGTLDFAVSYDTAPGAKESLEGTTVEIDVPVMRTFENREKFDQLLVDAAIGALENKKAR